MNVKNFFFALTVAVSTGITLNDAHKASALTWTVSDRTGKTASIQYWGQSFTPNNIGPSGSGSPPATGNVKLQSFSFGSNSAGSLYVFGSPYLGTAEQLATSNPYGKSALASQGIYQFSSSLQFQANKQYYAYADQQFLGNYSEPNNYT